MTAADIAWHMRNYAANLQHEWITPNAILYAWESDLLTVTRDQQVCEIEIKCSRADLLQDLKKPKHDQGMLMNGSFFEKGEGIGRTTGERLEEERRKGGEVRCRRPNYFCFAMPCEVYRKLPFGKLPRTPVCTPWISKAVCSKSGGPSSCMANASAWRTCWAYRAACTTAIGMSCGGEGMWPNPGPRPASQAAMLLRATQVCSFELPIAWPKQVPVKG